MAGDGGAEEAESDTSGGAIGRREEDPRRFSGVEDCSKAEGMRHCHNRGREIRLGCVRASVLVEVQLAS